MRKRNEHARERAHHEAIDLRMTLGYRAYTGANGISIEEAKRIGADNDPVLFERILNDGTAILASHSA